MFSRKAGIVSGGDCVKQDIKKKGEGRRKGRQRAKKNFFFVMKKKKSENFQTL